MQNENGNISIRQLRDLLTGDENSEGLVQQITDLFPALIYVFDAESRKLRYINRHITDLLGYAWEDISEWDNDFTKMIFDDDLTLVQEELEKYYKLEDNSSYSYNCRLKHKERNFRYFRTVGTVLRRNEKGSPSSMLFMAQDITEQIEIDQERAAARKLIEDAERMLNVGTWSWDIQTDKMEWSEGMYNLMGYSKEERPEITGELLYSHICERDRDDIRSKITTASNLKEEFKLEFSLGRKDGKRIFITSVAKPVLNNNGEVEKLTGFFRDISDQYSQNIESKASLELQKQTELLLNYGVFVWDLKTNNVSRSEGLRAVYEDDSDGRELKFEDFLKSIHDEDRERVETVVMDAIENRSDFEIEFAAYTRKGHLITVNSRGRVVVDNANVPIKIIGKTRDITRVKQVENELQRNVRELNRSNKELEEFAYAASHDLQEPLRKITTFGSRLREKFGDILGTEGQMYLDRMEAASGNMRNLIENLLELSRVSRSNHAFEYIDLSLVAREAILDLEIPMEESGAIVKVDTLPELEAIPSLIRQMFINLLGNALKFRKPDVKPEIRISAFKISRKDKELHLLPTDKNYYQIDVEDNGIGFDQDYEHRIFQIFQRLHGKSEYPGSGIGLSICKRIAERHNGQIFATGRPGEGATFSFIIPDKQ